MAKMIFVGCKIPSGLVLQLRDEATQKQVIGQAALNGSAWKGTPDIPAPNAVNSDGVGLTQVDEEFWLTWAAWADKNKYAPYVLGHVFAANTAKDVLAESKEKFGLKTGMEGLAMPIKNGDPDPRDPRLAILGNSQITPTTA